MERYNAKLTEKKWQEKWEKEKDLPYSVNEIKKNIMY